MSKTTTINHFPVGNGDMTLIKIASNGEYYYVLIDMCIREASQSDDDKCDVLNLLHDMLGQDEGIPYVDALILTHPDEDHIKGFEKYFHTGDPSDYKIQDENILNKILVKEIWSSPIIFRRKSKNHSLCEDAIAFNKEAKRRINLYKETKIIGDGGNRIRLIGEDIDGKTDDILELVYQKEDVINMVNEVSINELQATILAPLDKDEFEDSEVSDKNRSSVIIQWGFASHGYSDITNKVLVAGDATVEVWDQLWNKYNINEILSYDILITPHHCSWHTLSHDSFSEADNPQVSKSAMNALSQANEGAIIISSSNEILDDDKDPPNYKAMEQYQNIVENVNGSFQCLATYKPSNGKAPEIITYKLTREGPQEEINNNVKSNATKRSLSTGVLIGATGDAIGHG